MGIVEEAQIFGRQFLKDGKPIPVYSVKNESALKLDPNFSPENVKRAEIEGLDQAFTLEGVLTKSECEQLIELTEAMVYERESLAEVPDEVRLNESVSWYTDSFRNKIFQRAKKLLDQQVGNTKLLTLDPILRFYRYKEDQEFKKHQDGSSEDQGLVSNFTFLVYLNDDFEGGATTFFRMKSLGKVKMRGLLDLLCAEKFENIETERLVPYFNVVPVEPKQGMAAVWYHGSGKDPETNYFHAGSKVTGPTPKYVLITKVIYQV